MLRRPPARPCSPGCHAGRGRDVERPECQREAEAREQEGRQHRGRVARVESDRQEEHVARDDREQAGDDQPRDAEAHDERRDARRDDGNQHARGEDREPGVERRPAAQLLHVERRDELEADPAAEERHRARLARTSELERRMPSRTSGVGVVSSRRMNAAIRIAAPMNDEIVRAEVQPAFGASTSVKTSSSIAPVMLTAPATSKPAVGAGRASAVGHQAEARDERDQRDRGGQEEDPAPAAGLGQQSADHESEREAGRARRGVDRERLVARPSLCERRRDDREAGRGRERGAHALDEARDDEQRAVVDKRAEERGDCEHTKGNQEDTPPSEQIRGAAAEQKEPAVAEHVRAHDPLQRAGRETEVAADGGQRDADHRDVEGVQEEGAAEHEQRAPGALAEPSGAVIEGVRELWAGRGHVILLGDVAGWRRGVRSAIVRSASYILVRPRSNK